MSKVLKEKILKVDRIAAEIYKMTISSEFVAQNAYAGQFVNIKCSEGLDALLRRPISICSVDRNNNTYDIVFQVKGKGTEYLSQKKVGSELDVIAPLGNPFDLSAGYKKIAVVGGGIGIFPLLFLLQEKNDAQKTVFLGFRDKEHVVMEEEFRNSSDKIYISTDDGSYGNKGLVVDQLEKYLTNNSLDIIYTCGPMPMIKKVVEIAARNNIKCQVSLEERMGCGVGACLVCACKTRLGDDWEYSHVCKDGPVFWSQDVIFD